MIHLLIHLNFFVIHLLVKIDLGIIEVVALKLIVLEQILNILPGLCVLCFRKVVLL